MPVQNPELIRHYTEIHKNSSFGATARNFELQIKLCLQDLAPAKVLEYGCGKSDLIERCGPLVDRWDRYDPAIPEFSDPPAQDYDLIINTDVMEHIPPEDVDDVLADLQRCGRNVFFNISTRLAGKTLPDGTNAHCTVQSAEAWKQAIRKYFPQSEIAYEDVGEDTVILTWKSPFAYAVAGIGELKRALRIERKFKNRKGLRKLAWKWKQWRRSRKAAS